MDGKCSFLDFTDCLIHQLLFRYYTLPNVERYGRLLKLNPLLVKRPKLIKQQADFQNVSLSVLLLTTTIIIPLVSPENQIYADFATLALVVIYVIIWAFFFLFVVKSITDIFSKTLEGFCNNTRTRRNANLQTEETDQLKQAIRSIAFFKMQMLVSALFLVAELVLTMAFGLKHVYIFYNIGQVSLGVGLVSIQLQFFKTVSL